MPDLDPGTMRALKALCTADAEHPDAGYERRYQRAREILDSDEPGDSAHFAPAKFRELELIDEKNHLTPAALRIAEADGWEPPAGG